MMLDKTVKTIDLTGKTEHAVISPPNFKEAVIHVRGTAPFVMNRMSSENRDNIMMKQAAKSSERGNNRNKTRRPPKDFDKIYRGTMHVSKEGWYGIPATAFRIAMIDACRTVGYKMTLAKCSIFVKHKGIDSDDGTLLIPIIGEPKRRDMAVKLADGSTDIVPRAFFEDWEAHIHLEWDADQFTASDVMNLLARAGRQIGVGAGRPYSKTSAGMGCGTFELAKEQESRAPKRKELLENREKRSK